MVLEHTRLIPFRESDLAPLVNFWNNAFVDRRNFYSISATDFQKRILACEAFDPDGLILAWHEGLDGSSQVVGVVHAFRPAPRTGLYAKWEGRHNLALLYVDPAHRRQGIGSRLLRAAENWLYYCPVFVGGPAQPCYGTIEGPRPPFFGSTQRMGISVHDTLLLTFLARRGYHVMDPGEVSMQLALTARPQPALPEFAGLRLMAFSHERPFAGREPIGREEYTLYGDNGYSQERGAPYYGYAFVTDEMLLQAHISWYPMRQVGKAAIAGFWVAPALRGHGLGGYLLDRTLADLVAANFQNVEVQTHLVNHAKAVAIYEERGFEVVDAWVNMSKECAVRTAKDVGLSAY
jgi:GNAT superfamily N-acetyltransferase